MAGELASKFDDDLLSIFFQRIPIDLCRKHEICLFDSKRTSIPELVDETADLPPTLSGPTIARTTDTREDVVDSFRRFLRAPLPSIICSIATVQKLIDVGFEQHRTTRRSEPEAVGAIQPAVAFIEEVGNDLLQEQADAPIIELVNRILFDAVKQQASDVHFQPFDRELMVRFRMDGVLFDYQAIPQSVQEEVLARIKVAARMDIAEKRLPQDGRATVRVGSRTIDLRVASMPSSHGERIVVRLLDKSARLYSLHELGMDGTTLNQFRSAIQVEHGLMLVTGPTGSGKSTTLYAALKELDTKEKNAVTLEDPIEYQLDGISQTQINLKKGMTFASGLRSVLRQDPDIIMVGEIRDAETAVMAVQAALTGHLVFSTLHTNDAASAVTRMLDLGIEPFLLSSCLVAVLAQRLVRRLCPNCRRRAEFNTLPLISKEGNWFESVGCENCRGTGFRGRLGIYELMVVDEALQSLITQRTHASRVREHAVSKGMQLLSASGERKAAAGETTLAEVQRVTARMN